MVEEDASFVIPKYDIDTIIKEESASQIVEKQRKELWPASVNVGKSSKESSDTVEKLKVILKQFRGIRARELVARSDFEEILETAALYEELSSALIVEKQRKELWPASVNVGKSSKESSDTVEKLKVILKQFRGIRARELVARSDFEEILETAALYEELSSALSLDCAGVLKTGVECTNNVLNDT
ncbi:hypothetical protein Bca52824_018007 [Brassica carinata]|uniref:Uncharacterized protein n=1 Tax=Brassica carinata TaxID=52824 RepID=A0A8X7VPB8_BRACI|nr:hypothetical protein Bca52824_018007 [Brassica carinata]